MKTLEGEAQSFAGYHNRSAERTISALPIRIDYQSPRYEFFMRPRGKDWLFGFSRIQSQWNSGKIREYTNLDPYAIRDAFESADTPEKIVHFLSEAGSFWRWERVLWSQFQEWQQFFKWLRLDPKLARKDVQGKKALDTASGRSGRGSSFFAASDEEFTHSRIPPDAIEQLGAERYRENEVADHQELFHLRTCALYLGWTSNRRMMDISWYDSSNPAPPEDRSRSATWSKNATVKPYLRIEAHCVLEAIAATIYADRVHGLKYQKCKHCLKLFKIESDHGAIFCPAPRQLKSSPCKNAYFQKNRRDEEKRKAKLNRKTK
jgi:hypothetical protein